MCTHIHTYRLFKEMWERKKTNCCKNEKMAAYVIIQLSSPMFSFCHTLWKRDINFSSEEGLLSGPVQESVCSCTCALGYEENVRLNHSCGTPWIYIHWIFERIWEEVQGESQCVCACVLPGNLSSGVEVQCSHWLQHLHTAHILQQRQRRQNLH